MSDIIPDSITPVVGWRSWILHRGKLHSHINHSDLKSVPRPANYTNGIGPPWIPGEIQEAICGYGNLHPYRALRTSTQILLKQLYWIDTSTSSNQNVAPPPDRAIPSVDCRCGLYAVEDHEAVWALTHLSPYQFLMGEVYLWGRIIPGTRGYRAQYAYPKKLYGCPRHASRALSEEVAKLYRIPYSHFPDFRTMQEWICYHNLDRLPLTERKA